MTPEERKNLDDETIKSETFGNGTELRYELRHIQHGEEHILCAYGGLEDGVIQLRNFDKNEKLAKQHYELFRLLMDERAARPLHRIIAAIGKLGSIAPYKGTHTLRELSEACGHVLDDYSSKWEIEAFERALETFEYARVTRSEGHGPVEFVGYAHPANQEKTT